MKKKLFTCVAILSFLFPAITKAGNQIEKQEKSIFQTHLVNIGKGWSKTSVNATVFRKSSVVSFRGYQFAAYYDSTASVVLAKRKLGSSHWETHQTQYKGNVADAHNIISIAVDGKGYLHISWDHHNNALNYCKSLQPFGLEMGEKQSMIGSEEKAVTYPEFYRFRNGDLLFAYRDGGSGNGNLVLNRYDLATGKWKRLQSNLIDGEGKRNAYWQLYVDSNDKIYISWVWRETPDVSTNHDMCFAMSNDGGMTWKNSKGAAYSLPIRLKTAEIVYPIPPKSNLMNQTSMTADEEGNTYISTYYKGEKDSCTQFQLIYQKDGAWHHSTVSHRTDDFDLSGTGSRSVPISRPQLVIDGKGNEKSIYVFYRDEAFGNEICFSYTDIKNLNWQTKSVFNQSVGRWEPSYDSELWKSKHKLHLFFQNVAQGQSETEVNLPPQPVGVLEVGIKH